MNLKSLLGFWEKKNIKEPVKADSNKDGIIGQYNENGFPVIVKFVNKIPEESTQTKLPILTVISWKYDGSQRNGMPLNEVNAKMIKLEEAIENSSSNDKLFNHVYSRTGNNLKELVYYSRTQEDFMNNLNVTLSKHERYPIEIDFYEDKGWREFRKLLNDFKRNDENEEPKA